MMDPLGFALENFDAVGVWRTLGDAGGAHRRVAARCPTARAFDGAEGLRAALLKTRICSSRR